MSKTGGIVKQPSITVSELLREMVESYWLRLISVS